MSNTLGLYLHIPFCLGKCNYCDFYSLAAPQKMAAYTDVLCRELINRAKTVNTYTVDTVYVGGGTPSVLGVAALVQILQTVRENYNLAPQAEITVEVNPATVSAADLATLATVANRISIGVQSTDDNLLSLLGRRHTAAEAKETVLAAKAAGFANISCDLMYGLPHQTFAQLVSAIDDLAALPISHISLYGLIVEEGTPFGRQQDLPLPDDDTVADWYLAAISRLAEHGFAQYEISNFARDGVVSRHNLRYWHNKEFLGFGPAAYSYFDGARYGNPRDLAAYLATNGELAAVDALVCDREVLTPDDKEAEYLMLRLRLAEGVNAAAFAATFGKDFWETYQSKALPYIESGHMVATPDGVHFTARGFAISNFILSDLLNL